MSTSSTTLASLWDEVSGHNSPLRTLQSTPTKVMVTTAGSEIKEDALRFYRHSGMEGVAKEVGILPADGTTDLITVRDQNTQPRVQMIAVSSPMKQSIIKTENQQPGQRLVQSSPSVSAQSPVILSASGTPHRVLQTAQLITPKGAQLIATPVQIESPQQTWSSGARKRVYLDSADYNDSAKRRKGEKGGKGLRHFSMKVCEKVKRKGVTSYNEVADELVSEFTDPRNMVMTESGSQPGYDQKNIRRRVYDALNVLMAMNIISKEKKEIRWIGLPTNSAQECHNLENEKRNLQERIRYKTQQLQDLILQQIAFKNLVQRNRQREETQGPPAPNSAIQLPFIIVNTSKKTVIDCSISNDKCEYLFNFDNTFEIHDDIEVLKRMGMGYGLENGKCSPENLKRAIKMVPKALEPYVLELAKSSPSGTQAFVSLSNLAGSSTATASTARYTEGSSTEMPGPSSLDHSLDAEVAQATSYGLSRQSSIGSYSDIHSARDSPEDDYSDEDESVRSSPTDI